ncbi:MAG: glycosyltransferase family 39 protein [Lachnospiraceae bacterium]|nr:glycosyltransferase family 39 protein [Lachnospiraceae bacterium]
MKQLRRDIGIEALFFTFVLGIWLFWAFLLPLNEGPDENMRLQIAQFILKYGKLPTGYQKEIMDYTWGFTYAFRPILPQMVEALFIGFAMIFTEDAFTLLFAGRLVSVLSGVVFFWYVWALGSLLFERKSLRGLFLLLNVCLPQSSLLFTYLNCDSTALMASAMILYYLGRGMKDAFSIRTCIWLGVSLSVCVLSYYNAYGFLLTAALVFAGCFLERARNGERCGKEFFYKGFLILGLVLALTGWWFVRNYVLYEGDFLGLRTQEECAELYAMDLFKPSGRRNCINMGMSLTDMLFRSDWTFLVFKGFVGILAPLTEAHRAWIFAGYGGLFLIGGMGVLAFGVRGMGRKFGPGSREKADKRKAEKRKEPVDVSRIMLHLGLVIAIVLPNALNIWYSYSNDYQPQGRYSMPMLVPFMYYVTWGLGYWGQRLADRWPDRGAKWRRSLERLACLWIILTLVYSTVGIMWPAYRNVEDKAEVRVYSLEELFGVE